MCLTAYHKNTFLTADRDIVCYKVLCFKDGRWVSPYVGFDYTEYVNNLGLVFEDKVEPNINWELKIYGILNFNEGFVHFYTDPFIAKCSLVEKNYGLFECIIPVGTEYSLGKYDDICAKKFKFVRKMI